MNSALRSRHPKLLGLVLAGLVLAVGFCLFDSDDGDGHAGLDLCLGMLVTSLTVTLVSRLPLTGSTTADRAAAVTGFSLQVPCPPPKPAPY